MNKVLYIILIFLFSLTVISCSKKDESSSSSDSSITLSDVSANIAGSKYIITTESSGGASGRSNAKTNSKTESLLVISESGEIDYGLISNNQLVIKYNILSPSGDYLYLLLDTSDANTSELNCAIIQVKTINNDLKCIAKGLAIDVDNYLKSNTSSSDLPLQFDANENIYFLAVSFTGRTDETLNCVNQAREGQECLYKYTIQDSSIQIIKSILDVSVQQIKIFHDGGIAYTGGRNCRQGEVWVECDYLGLEILYNDTIVETYENVNYSGYTYKYKRPPFTTGSNNTVFFGGKIKTNSEDINSFQFSRFSTGRSLNSFIMPNFINFTNVFLETNGEIHAYGHYVNSEDNVVRDVDYYLFKLLPYSNNYLFKLNDTCYRSVDDGINCKHYINYNSNIVYYSKLKNYSGKISSEILATRLSDNHTTTIMSNSNNCESDCYLIEKWFLQNEKIYISLIDVNGGSGKFGFIDRSDFDIITNNGINYITGLDTYLQSNNVKNVQELSNTNSTSSVNPSAEIKHEVSDNISARVEFTKDMNYSDVEGNISVIDNSTNQSVWFMPVWNNKTLHMLFDTDNGTSYSVESNPLTSGKTYKVTLLGSAKDSDGNTLGSDVVKYITP